MTTYQQFLESKKARNDLRGFEPLWEPEFLFDFQRPIVDWSIKLGRAALFEDCGLGKSPQELVWAENMVRHTNRPVLILTPLAVAAQFIREGEKFGIEVYHARDGRWKKGINVVNYQRLHYFRPDDFAGLVCDESGVLKHHEAQTRRDVTAFAENISYILLGTATPAPNDYMELGNSAEVLGVMKYFHMLAMFFTHESDETAQWRLKGHAKTRFWEWVSTWARAIRKPSDMGFDDGKFRLPPLKVVQHEVPSGKPKKGWIPTQARTRNEQLAEARATMQARCEMVASLVPEDRPFVAWCHLNAEGDLLTRLIPGAVQVAGSDDIDEKEKKLEAFSRGQIKRLVTKPKIGGFGLNWQHCSDIAEFVSHSYEMHYQLVRRFYRFGQQREVTDHVVSSEGEARVLSNMKAKELRAGALYDGIIRGMGRFQRGEAKANGRMIEIRRPVWL